LAAKADVIAAGVKARLQAGESAKAIADALGFDGFTTTPFNRLGQGLQQGALPATLMDEAFTMNVDDVTLAQGTGAHTVARLTAVQAADINTADDLYRSLHDNTLQDLQADLATQLATALQGAYGVTINQKALNDAY